MNKKDKVVMPNSIVMPDSMKVKATQLFNQKALADTALQNFLAGCVEGLGLKGDWNLDVKTLIFTKMPEVAKESS